CEAAAWEHPPVRPSTGELRDQTQFAWHARLHDHAREACPQNPRCTPLKNGEQVCGHWRVLPIELPVPTSVERPGIPPGENASVPRRSFERQIHKSVHVRPLVRRAILATIRLETILHTGSVVPLVTRLVRPQRGANVQRPSHIHVCVLLDEDGGLTSLESDRCAIEACARGD